MPGLQLQPFFFEHFYCASDVRATGFEQFQIESYSHVKLMRAEFVCQSDSLSLLVLYISAITLKCKFYTQAVEEQFVMR